MRFTIQKLQRLIDELSHYRYKDRYSLNQFRIIENWEDAFTGAGSGTTIQVGDRWGGSDKTVYFASSIPFQKHWIDEDVVALIRLGNTGGGNCSGYEALAWIDGIPYQGLDKNHAELFFNKEHLEKGEVTLGIQAWSGLNPPDGAWQPFDHRIEQAELCVLDAAADDLYFTALHALESVKILNDDALEKHRLLNAINESIALIDWRNPGSAGFYQSIAAACSTLHGKMGEIPRGLRPHVTAIGHCHIDVAWLWRLSHTREKSARSWSTVLRLMEKFPEYSFLQSQPQLYKYMKEDYPVLYEQIKQKAHEGRWETEGAMWLESDCNIPSGESLVRQIIYGNKYLQDEFGYKSKILWLPDVFGYSWALPQILKKSGIEYFMTTKISWNQYNRFPHDTFCWRGIDGTEILTHYITTPNNDGSWYYTYNGNVNASSVQGLWTNYRQKDINDSLLLAYGWGDGGGGPTREMIEAARRFKDMPGLPEVRTGTALAYFEELESRVSQNPYLPLWDGELYLEYHRGTYTSQAYNKKMNRRLETHLHNAESIGVMAAMVDATFVYPKEVLDEAWEIVLRNQFHDIIPGSSIHEVYIDSRDEYDQAERLTQKALDSALQSMNGLASSDSQEHSVYRLINTLGWKRSEIIEIPWKSAFAHMEWHTANHSSLLTQSIHNGQGQPVSLLIEVRNVPSYGTVLLTGEMNKDAVAPQPVSEVSAGADYLENDIIKVLFDQNGRIASVFDKLEGREVVKPGQKANVLQVFEDKPMAHDSWDIDIYYQEKMWEVSELVEAVVEEQGPLRAAVRMVWKFNNSIITQRIRISQCSRKIDFVTHVVWNENQHLLKAAFPVDIRSTKATYEIQFGNVERPTHWNTSWDWARFESVAQRWVDMSERGYGVSLLNDCKYGHDIRNHIMRISLIKSATYPDHSADQGEHEFTYSLYPHPEGWLEAETHRRACELNVPLIVSDCCGYTTKEYETFSLVQCDAENIMLDTLKPAEVGSGYVLRLYEYGGKRSKVKIRLAETPYVGMYRVEETDLTEKALRAVPIQQGGFDCVVQPYEIKTYCIRMKSGGE